MAPKQYENTVTVAAVNWSGTWGDKKANLEKMKQKAAGAAKTLGANLICFPELALSGYECGEETMRDKKPCAMHTELAELIPGPATDEMAKLAKELDVYIVFGMPERDPQEAADHYISTAVVGPEGLIGKYRKINLSPPPIFGETYCHKPGTDLPVFETRYGLIGIQICYDFWIFPELSRLLRLKGARLIINTAASPAGIRRPEYIAQQTGCRATENLVYALSCNYVGKERTMSYYGNTVIAGPSFPGLNRIFAQGGDKEETVFATLNFDQITTWHQFINIKDTVNWKFIASEYQKIAGS